MVLNGDHPPNCSELSGANGEVHIAEFRDRRRAVTERPADFGEVQTCCGPRTLSGGYPR
jgi:hypothetical protein